MTGRGGRHTTDGGGCIHFHELVRALLPVGPMKRPALTVTVDEPTAWWSCSRPTS